MSPMVGFDMQSACDLNWQNWLIALNIETDLKQFCQSIYYRRLITPNVVFF